MGRMEYIAEEISQSPYQVRMLSKQDDVEIFRSDLTMNEGIELYMVEGSGKFLISKLRLYDNIEPLRHYLAIQYARELFLVVLEEHTSTELSFEVSSIMSYQFPVIFLCGTNCFSLKTKTDDFIKSCRLYFIL